MITDKQLVANQENAKLGGVKTEDGKAVSRFNAIKHGIFMNFMTKEECDFADLVFDAIIEDTKPQTQTEYILAGRIASWAVRLKRAVKAEQEYLLLEDIRQNPSTGGEASRFNIPTLYYKNIEEMEKTYLKYEGQIERNMYRALHELQRIQALRNGVKSAVPIGVDMISNSTEQE